MKMNILTAAVVATACFVLPTTAAFATSTIIESRHTHEDSIWGDLTYYEYNTQGTASAYDYGDADEPYGDATNWKGTWQGLGTSNGIDDGVMWSVAGSDFGTSESLVIGEEVTFKFLFWQANNGSHTYDQIWAALDYGQDGIWGAEDVIGYQKISTINWYESDSNMLSRYIEFELTLVVPETMTVGSTWLRTRAHCNHTEYGDITAYNYLGQGETEDYLLNIVAETSIIDPIDPGPSEVPEPATMILFGTGLLGLAGLRSRK